jgi:hypothetical protein
MPRSRAVSAGGGRCWVRTNAGLADGSYRPPPLSLGAGEIAAPFGCRRLHAVAGVVRKIRSTPASRQVRGSPSSRLQDGTAAGTPLAVVDNCRALLRRCRLGVYLNMHQPQPPGSIADRNRPV